MKNIKFNISNLPKYLIKLTKKYSNRLVLGQNRSVFKGSGIEFVDIREYIEGDDPRYIDWNVSARMNHLFVRNFQEEREIPIYAVLDLDSSLFFGTRNKLKIELLEELLAIVINLSLSLSERLGAIISFKEELAFFRPSKNFSNLFKILTFLNNIINDFKKNKEKYFGFKSNIEKLLKLINEYIKRTSTIVIFSSLIDIKNYDTFEKYLRTIKKIKNNEVYLFKLSDKSEIYLNLKGIVNIQDPLSKKILTLEINDKVIQQFKIESLKKIKKIEEICKRNNINFLNFYTDDKLEIKFLELMKNKKLYP